jgi:hypothetical protein
MIVVPEDPVAIAAALRVALTDDGLVDRAAEHNVTVAKLKIDTSVIGPKVVQMYRDVLNTSCSVSRKK